MKNVDLNLVILVLVCVLVGGLLANCMNTKERYQAPVGGVSGLLGGNNANDTTVNNSRCPDIGQVKECEVGNEEIFSDCDAVIRLNKCEPNRRYRLISNDNGNLEWQLQRECNSQNNGDFTETPTVIAL